MQPSFRLDLLTLLICGHLLLMVMAGAMLAVRPVPGLPFRSLRLWVVSLALFMAPAGLLVLIGPPPETVPSDPPVGLFIASGVLAAAAALQWIALREATGSFTSWRKTAAYSAGMFAAATALAWLLPPEFKNRAIALAHVAIPMLALPALAVLSRQGRGGRMVVVFIGLGMLMNGLALTVVQGLNAQGREPVLLALCDIVARFGASLGLLLWYQERIQQLLAQAAMTDALTGALNRHGLLPQLDRELSRAKRSGRPVSIVLCDLDHFKQVNDLHGHAAGDAVLKAFVNRARALLRKSDLLGRWGGEEFLFILPDTATRDAVMAAERLRQTPAAAPGLPAVTFSAGVATSGEDGRGYSPVELLAAADRLLYVAKETRDRVVSGLVPGTSEAATDPPSGAHEAQTPPMLKLVV